MNGRLVLPMLVHIVAQVFDELGNAMSIDRLVIAAGYCDAGWTEIACIVADPFEGRSMKRENCRRTKFPALAFLYRVYDHAACAIELKQAISRFCFGALLLVPDQIGFTRHTVATVLLTHGRG